MSLLRSIGDTAAGFAAGLRRVGCLYAVGGPVGLFHAARLALLKRRMARLAEYITREKETNRANLLALNFELTQLVAEQQRTSIAAAQFWNWCEKKAGVQP